MQFPLRIRGSIILLCNQMIHEHDVVQLLIILFQRFNQSLDIIQPFMHINTNFKKKFNVYKTRA